MASYKVIFNTQVRRKDLARLPSRDISKILEKIETLAANPFPEQAKKLKGREEWRIRQGDYRILYTVHHEIVTIHIIKVGHRKEVYRAN
jgi:mRNA interferase RelE/StbE